LMRHALEWFAAGVVLVFLVFWALAIRRTK
jgi:hypothetical protein